MTAKGTEARVCQDIAARQQKGVSKYGTTVAENPLGMVQWLQHAYEEALDQAIYLKRAIEQLQGVSAEVKPSEHLNLPVVKSKWLPEAPDPIKEAARALQEALNENAKQGGGLTAPGIPIPSGLTEQQRSNMRAHGWNV